MLCVIGPRQPGKTSFVKSLRSNWLYFDLERQNHFDYLSRDFTLFFEHNTKHIIIDEAQELTQLFRELRGVIDNDRNLKGAFILPRTSSPELYAAIH